MKLHPESASSVVSDIVVCRCLNVTETEVVEAVSAGELATVKELRCATGAGGGCLACHGRLREYIRRHQAQRVLESRNTFDPVERRLA